MQNEQRPASGSTGTSPGFKVAVAIGAVLLLGSVGGVTALVMSQQHPDSTSMAVAPGGTIRLDQMMPMVAQHYRFAADHPSVYEQVPCYCGCQSMLAHRSLLQCFVRPDGGWERHAAGCAVCTEESSVVRSMLADGAGVHAIRTAVIDQFSTTGG